MALVFVVSILVYYPTTGFDFINTWDDEAYVLDNKVLKDLSAEGISNIFKYGDDFQSLVNNYHPLTTLSLALNYRISGLNPAPYHATNMVFHGFNAILAFLFIFLLGRRKLWPALVSGLLFAVHPMHVESVAWISERKDVLYVFFFLAGLIVYLLYLEDKKIWKLGLALLLFICSCLSKAMAVAFPVVLLLIDYQQHRRFSWRLVVEKLPFFLTSLLIGVMSVRLQSLSAINEFETFTLYQRLMHASYGFLAYILKFFWPAGLSAFYPYPAITPEGVLPLAFRIAPVICLIIAGLVAWLAMRKDETSRTVVFGILFYFFTIALVLQFLSVGKAIMADRYTYLPYIGLSFIAGMITLQLADGKGLSMRAGYMLGAIIGAGVVIFGYLARERIKVWKDDIALWSDALEKYPDSRLNFIYEKRAREYLEVDNFEAALADYSSMIANNPQEDNALEAIGRLYGKYYHDLGKALEYLEKAYAINPKNPAVLKSLGVATGMKGDIRRSLDYLLEAYALDMTDTTLVLNIIAGYNYLGMPAKAKEFERLAGQTAP